MKTTTILLTAIAAQQATATWDLFAKPLKTPRYNDNVCSDKQKGGFDWSDLKDGDKDFKYGDFDFSGGWSCSSSLGKRDQLTRRTFGSKMIKNSCTKEKPATFSCDSKPSGFSVKTIDVSVEFDAELEFHYKMGDGSTCKQYSSCSQGGTTVTNTQCGGAKSVDVYLGKHHKGTQESCEIGVHHIGFDCDKGTTYTPPKAPEAPPATSSAVPATSSAVVSSAVVESSSAAATTYSVFESSSAVVASSSAVVETSSSAIEISSSAVVASSSAVVASSSAIETPATTVCGQYGGPLCSTSAVGASSIVLSSTAVPYTNTSTTAYNAAPPSVASSTPLLASSIAASSVVVPASSSAVVAISSSSSAAPQPSTPSYPPVSPPDVLPKCMNTWLQVDDKCKNNADKSCYCKNPEFTKNVIDCVTAWCGTDEETQKSLQYLIGICAEHVPENPKIIEDCPSYIPLNPAPPAAPTGGASTIVSAGVSTIVSAGVSTTVSAGVSTIVSAGVSTIVSAGVSTVVSTGYSTIVSAGVTTTVAVIVTPAPSAPAPSVPAGVTPAPSAPGAPAPEYPVTTITYGTTSITVPMVHFTTETNVAGASPTEPVGLVGGDYPVQTPAATTGSNGAPYPIASTFGTQTAPFATGTGAIRPTSPPEFTGAAAAFKVPASAFICAALAFFAL